MKEFNYRNVTFFVDEEWYAGIVIRPAEDEDTQVFCQAMSDPEKSGITTDDPAYTKAIDEAAELVQAAKDMNAIHAGKGADIAISMAEPGKYEVLFAGGQVYEAGSLKVAKRAIEKLGKYLEHNNVIKVAVVKAAQATDLKKAMDLEVFLNNCCHKVISVAPAEGGYLVVYIPRGFRNCGSCSDYD